MLFPWIKRYLKMTHFTPQPILPLTTLYMYWNNLNKNSLPMTDLFYHWFLQNLQDSPPLPWISPELVRGVPKQGGPHPSKVSNSVLFQINPLESHMSNQEVKPMKEKKQAFESELKIWLDISSAAFSSEASISYLKIFQLAVIASANFFFNVDQAF